MHNLSLKVLFSGKKLAPLASFKAIDITSSEHNQYSLPHPYLHISSYPHRDHSIIHLVRASMHCKGISCTRSFNVGLTSAEGQKLECFKRTANNIFHEHDENLVDILHSKVMPVFYINLAISLCVYYHFYAQFLLQILIFFNLWFFTFLTPILPAVPFLNKKWLYPT